MPNYFVEIRSSNIYTLYKPLSATQRSNFKIISILCVGVPYSVLHDLSYLLHHLLKNNSWDDLKIDEKYEVHRFKLMELLELFINMCNENLDVVTLLKDCIELYNKYARFLL